MSMPVSKPENKIGGAWEGIKKVGGRFARRFAFEMFIQEYYPTLIKEMRSSLSTLSPEDVKQMIATGQYPDLAPRVYASLQGYEEYLQYITPQRLWRAMVEACPKLARAIDECGDSGYHWFARFRLRILKGIAAGAAPNGPGESSVPMTGLTCTVCGKTQLVRVDSVASIKECPFCHTPATDDGPPPSGGPESPEPENLS